MTNTTANAHAFPVGSKVKVAAEHAPKTRGLASVLPTDTVLTVESCRSASSGGFQVRVEGINREYGSDWFVYAEAPVREKIPFTLTKDTSKGYALKQASRALDAETNKVLRAAGKGQEVDAVEFRKAVTAALSLAATRAGQSMGRRKWTSECRHLLYIVDAVLDNAYAGLPPVDAGTRSPKIHQQEQEINDLRNTVKRLAADAQRAADALEHEKMLRAEAIVEKTEHERAWKNLAESSRNRAKQMDYALSLLDEPSKFKVVGFGDAVSWLA